MPNTAMPPTLDQIARLRAAALRAARRADRERLEAALDGTDIYAAVVRDLGIDPRPT